MHSSAAQEQGSAQCSAWSPGLRRARRVAGTQGVKRGRPGRAAGRRRARELGLQTAPAGPGVRAPAQPQPPARAQPHSAPAPDLPRSELHTPRCAPLGAETSAHPKVSSGHGSPANPKLRRGDRRLRGDDKLSSGRRRVWEHLWGREAAGAAGGLGLDSRTPLPGQFPAWGEGASGTYEPALGWRPHWGTKRKPGPPQRRLCEAHFADWLLWVLRGV